MNYNLKSDLRNPLAVGSSVTARVKAVVANTLDVIVKESQLSIPVEAGATYLVEAWLPFNLYGVESGYVFKFSGPSTDSVLLRSTVINGVEKSINHYTQATALGTHVENDLANAGDHELQAIGEIKFSTAGEFYVGFSHLNKTPEEPITLKAGGYLRLTKLLN